MAGTWQFKLLEMPKCACSPWQILWGHGAKRPGGPWRGWRCNWFGRQAPVRHAGQTPALRCPRLTGMQLGAADKLQTCHQNSSGGLRDTKVQHCYLDSLTDYNPVDSPTCC